MWNVILPSLFVLAVLAEQICKVQEGANRLEKAGCPEIYDAYICEGVVETLELHEDSEGCSGVWHTQWNFVAEDGKLEFPEIKNAGSALLSGDAVIFEHKHKLHQWTELASNRRLLKALEAHERGEIQFASTHYEPMTVEQEVEMLHRVADAYAYYELHEDAKELRWKAEALERRRRLGLTSVLADVGKAGMDFCKSGACETAFKVGMEKMFEIAEGLDQDFCEKAGHLKYYQNMDCCGGNQCFLFFCHMDGSPCGEFWQPKEPIGCCDGYDYNPQSLRCYKEKEVCPWGMTSCSLVGPFAPAPYCSRGAGACWSKVAELIFKVGDVALSIGGMIMTGGASTAIKTAIKTGAKALGKGMAKAVARSTLKTAFKQAFKAIAKQLKSVIVDQFKAVAQELIFTYIVEEVSMTLAGKNAQSEGLISEEDLIGMCDPTAIYDLVKFFENIDDCQYYDVFTQDQLDEMRLQSIMNSQELEPEQIAPFFGTWKGRYESWMDYKYIKLSIDCEGTLGILGLESSTMVFDKEYVLDMCGYDKKYKFVVFDLWGSDWYDCGYVQGLLKLQRFKDSDKTLVQGYEMVALPDGKRDPEMPCTEEDRRRRLAALGAKFTQDEMAIGGAGVKMLLLSTRTNECDWDGVDSSNIRSLGGGGHSESSCLSACEDRALCNFAAISDDGYCHLFETCGGQGSSGWKVYYKETTAGECIDVTVGGSSSNSKTVNVDPMYDCPKNVDKTKWDRAAAAHNADAGDTFGTSREGSQLKVTRTDLPNGWGLNLKFECCSSDRDEQYFFADFAHQYGTWNQNECDVFLTEHQCQELATIEDYIGYTTQDKSDKPRGCIVNWDGDVIFNTASVGSKNPSWAPICEDRAPADYSTASNVNVEIMAGATYRCDNYLSPAECEDFAGDMGDPVVSEFYKLGFPAGCLIDFKNSKRFLYNTVPDGSHGEGDIDVAPVCKICDDNGRDCSWVSKVSEETEGERVFVYRASVLGKGHKKITFEEADIFCRDQGLMLASPRNHYDVNEILKQATELMSLMREEDIKKGEEASHSHFWWDSINKEQSRDMYATGDYTPKILLGLTCAQEADCSQLENWKWPDGSSSTGDNFKIFKEGDLHTESHTYLTVEEYETKFIEEECKTEISNRDQCNAGVLPSYGWYGSYEQEFKCNDDYKKELNNRAETCMNGERSRITTPQRNEWARLAGRGKWEFQQCGYLNWEDNAEGATMIETEICENAIYNVFACQTMIKKGLPLYEPSKCAPRNKKEPCSAQTIREVCLRTTEDASFSVESDLDCVWCISGNCAVDQDVRCATRKFMNDIGKTVNPTHKKSTIVGYKNGAAIVEEVDSVGTYEYCKVVAEDATEQPSFAPTGFGRSVDIKNRVTKHDMIEGYLKLRDSDSGGWGLVCNAGVTESMREMSCSELGYGNTYKVDVNKKYNFDYGGFDDGGYDPGYGGDGYSITYWNMYMDSFLEHYSGDWYMINSCKGNEDSLNECSYTKTRSCSEGVFVIGCMLFEPKPGCSNYVAKVSYSYHDSSYSYSTSQATGYSDGYDEGHGLIFEYIYTQSSFYGESGVKKQILVYTDYNGNTLKTGELAIETEGIPSNDWKNTLKWQAFTDQGSVQISEFHTQCGGMIEQSILSSFGSSKLAHALALIGIFSLMYMACRKSKTDDFTLINEQEET